MKAFEVFAIYVTPFLIIGAAIRLFDETLRRRSARCPKACGQAGAQLLLGAWYKDE